MKLAQRLYAKGWTDEELAHLDKHFRLAQDQRHPTALIAERFVYWFYLLCVVLGIIAFGHFFFPFLARQPTLIANLVTAFVAGCLAALFGHVLHDLDELTPGHHALIIVSAIAAAIGSSWFVLVKSLGLGVLFSITFTLLYGYYWWHAHERNTSA